MDKVIRETLTKKFKGITFGFSTGFAIGLTGFVVLELTLGFGFDAESVRNMLITGVISGLPTVIPFAVST